MNILLRNETEKRIANVLERVAKLRDRFPAKSYNSIVTENRYKDLLSTLAINKRGMKMFYIDLKDMPGLDLPPKGVVRGMDGVTYAFEKHHVYPSIYGVVVSDKPLSLT